MEKFFDAADQCEAQGLEGNEMAKCFLEGFVNMGFCIEEELPEPSEMDEEVATYGPCTQNCTRSFNDTLVNHCDEITDPKEFAKCFYKAFATWALCLTDCANKQ